MTAADYSAIAAAISATCALFTLYIFRTQSKGFVWTKDQKISLLANKEGKIHVQIEVPLFNLGKGNVQFIGLRAKKINMKTKAMENFEMDMDEAHFPGGASIVSYRTAIHTEMEADEKTRLLIAGSLPTDVGELKEYEKKINQKLAEVPEHIVILKCSYKDGSWFGKRTRTTVIGLAVQGPDVTYLSTARRKELNEFFAW